jgi:hypothetical protein
MSETNLNVASFFLIDGSKNLGNVIFISVLFLQI